MKSLLISCASMSTATAVEKAQARAVKRNSLFHIFKMILIILSFFIKINLILTNE